MKDLPYVIHTNLELGLMLRGIKPLAMFVSEYERTPACLVRYFRMFDRHVESGRFVKSQHAVTGGAYRFCYVFYALPAEAWRIDRMIRLKELSGPWDADREREEGHLLGYEDWMNDVWADLRMRKTQSNALHRNSHGGGHLR